jgi:hypothetical protein
MPFTDDPEFMRLWTSLLYAIIAGVIFSLLGYFKRPESSEVFSGEQFFTSAVVGVIAGFASFYLEISPQQALVLILADQGLVYTIENLAKAVWRRWLQPWLKNAQQQTTPPS